MAYGRPGRDGIFKVGDGVFTGLDSHLSPDKLSDGMVSVAENVRMRTGEAVTRPGNPIINWFYPEGYPFDESATEASAGHIDDPGHLDIERSVISNATPEQKVVGSGKFSHPGGTEYAVVLTDKSAWFGSANNDPFEVEIPGGCPDENHLEQAFDRLFLFRGKNQVVLEFNLGRGTWAGVDEATTTRFTLPIPNSDRGLFFQNRLWVHVEDRLYFSDIGNPSRYYYLENEVRVNSGGSDKIEALFPFGKYSLLVFLTNSIYILSDLYGDLAANMRLQLISSRVGCGAPDSITAVGSQIWFVDQCGHLWDIEQIDADRAEISGRPRSWPIFPAMQEAGARDISDWSAVYHDGYYMLFIYGDRGVISDDYDTYSELGRIPRVAVFDTIIGNWVSLDWDLGMTMAGKPILLDWNGCERVMTVDQWSGNLRVIGYGDTDGTRVARVSDKLSNGAPTFRVTTRAYFSERDLENQFNNLKVQYSAWDSDVNINMLTDSANDVELISDETITPENRNDYLNWDNTGPWNPSNANQDFYAPYRRDYAVYPGDGIDLSDGIDLAVYQSNSAIKALSTNAGYLQLQVEGSGGSLRLRDIYVSMRASGNFQGDLEE